MVKIVYSRRYNIGFYGLERLHPFDSRKYGRVWRMLGRHWGYRKRGQLSVRTRRPVSQEELRQVHSQDYLHRLRDANYVAQALEVNAIRRLPAWIVDWHVLRPMRWATRGTIVAAMESMKHGLSINLGGGFHHAKPNHGEGFSIYADIGIAIESVRQQGLLDKDARVVYVDTDAHMGNGVGHTAMNDRCVFLFDIFNSQIFPQFDVQARERIDCEIGIGPSISNQEYMNEIRSRLPGFLDSVCRAPVGLAIYNAGTDVFDGDPLGGLRISADTIFERDMYVVGELRRRKIPTVMVLSGGYTRRSFELVSKSVIGLVEREMAGSEGR